MYLLLLVASLSLSLLSCNEPDCGADETKVGNYCRQIPRDGGAHDGPSPSPSQSPIGGDSRFGAEQAADSGISRVDDSGMPTDEALDSSTTVPAAISDAGMRKVVRIFAGTIKTCARWSSGQLSCWGYVLDEVGKQTSAPSEVATVSDVAEIELNNSSCLRTSAGEVRCWPRPSPRRDGNAGLLAKAISVNGLPVTMGISTGAGHGCAALISGEVRCWGSNVYLDDVIRGQLGVSDVTERAYAAAVPELFDADEVDVGQSYSCARVKTGLVHCWGLNFWGQLGDGTTIDRAVPKPVLGITTAKKIAVGISHACAKLSDDTVVCWGDNGSGSVGNGRTSFSVNAPEPVVSLGQVVDVVSGGGHSCALQRDRTVKCWGSNSKGQLGDGTTAFRAVPTLVKNLSAVEEIAAGLTHTCARLNTGGVKCWGDNHAGQLGNGRTIDTSIPVDVIDLD